MLQQYRPEEKLLQSGYNRWSWAIIVNWQWITQSLEVIDNLTKQSQLILGELLAECHRIVYRNFFLVNSDHFFIPEIAQKSGDSYPR